jgi:glycosyltransferase involved in cell wall biosynthesis
MPDVVLPVLDEAKALPHVLGALPLGFRPIVVDNGSADGSGRIAAALGAVVVQEPRRGYGAAAQAGLRAATDDVVCFMACDGSLDPADLLAVAAPVEGGRSDLVIGERVSDRGAWPLHGRVLNQCLAMDVRRRSGLALRDLGPMRAARREPLLALGLTDARFGWPLEMVLRAARAGWRVAGVPVSYRPRIGRSKVTGTVRGTVAAIHDMWTLLH